jgi:hypothetical protein
MRTVIRRAVLAFATGTLMMTMAPVTAAATPTNGSATITNSTNVSENSMRPANPSPGTPDQWCEPKDGHWITPPIGSITLRYVRTAHESKGGSVVRARYYRGTITYPPLNAGPRSGGPIESPMGVVRHECGEVRANEHSGRAPRR